MGLTDVKRLDELRKARDKARTAYEESEKTRQAVAMGGSVSSSIEMGLDKVRGLFDSAYEFGERYEQLGALSLPAADAALRQRSRNRIGTTSSLLHSTTPLPFVRVKFLDMSSIAHITPYRFDTAIL